MNTMKTVRVHFHTTTSEGLDLTYPTVIGETVEETIRRYTQEDVPEAVEVPCDKPQTLRFEAPDGWWSEDRICSEAH